MYYETCLKCGASTKGITAVIPKCAKCGKLLCCESIRFMIDGKEWCFDCGYPEYEKNNFNGYGAYEQIGKE